MAFEALQVPDWNRTNALFNPAQMQILQNAATASNFDPQIAQNKADTGTQDLADRATLRGLNGLLASGDPNGFATAATLGANGQNALSALGNLNNQQISGGIALGQAWGALPAGMSPPSAPWLGQRTGTPLSGTGNPLMPAQGGSTSVPPGLVNGESGGNPAAVNKQGYSGSLQFGTGRMTDLGMYHPTEGENPNGNQWQGTITVPGFAPMTHAQFLANPDAQRMAGEVQFKDIAQNIDNTPGAQAFDRNGLMAVAHLGGVKGMQQFVATNGQYNPHDANGTSLQNYYQRFSSGGVPALQSSFGHPDGPLPANHPARVQMASAQPQTMNDASPATVPATPDAVQALLASYRNPTAPAVAQSAAPTADVAADPYNSYRTYPVGQGDVVAAGQGETRVAASPEALANVNAPVPGQGITAPQAVAQARSELDGQLQGAPPDQYAAAIQKRALEIMQPQQAAPTPPAGGTQVASLGPVAPQGAPQAPSAAAQPLPMAPSETMPAAQAPAPTAAPQQVAQTQAQPQAGQVWQPQVPPGFQLMRNNMGMPMPYGPPGFGLARNAAGESLPVRITPPELKFEKTPTAIIGTDPNTGRVVSQTPITETGRQTLVPTTDGNQVWINGHPTGQVIPYSGRPEQNEAYKNDQKSVNGIIGIAQQAQAIAPRLNEMADLGKQLLTGPTAEIRGKAQAYLEQLGVDPAAASRLTGMSSAAAFQEFTKLATSTAGAAAKDDLGSNNGVQAMGIYMGSNPNVGLMQGANTNITNMMRVLNQSKQDYAQAALNNFKGQEAQFLGSNGKGAGTYTPLSAFNQQWLAQNNPHVYATAMGMLNGDGFDKWSQRVDPKEAARAAGIVARIDPNAQIQVKGGVIPARDLLAKVGAPAQ